jgi:hypothetical protein
MIKSHGQQFQAKQDTKFMESCLNQESILQMPYAAYASLCFLLAFRGEHTNENPDWLRFTRGKYAHNIFLFAGGRQQNQSCCELVKNGADIEELK